MSAKLTVPEWRHLLALLNDAEEQGAYYGNKEQYWDRHDRIMQKLQDLFNEQHPEFSGSQSSSTETKEES